MRTIKINQEWDFGLGPVDLGNRLRGKFGDRIVNLPHDYMIESDVFPEAVSGPASGYYNAAVAHYAREIDIPANTIMLKISDEEMAKRKAEWQPREPKITTGYLARYAKLVSSGAQGAVLS